MSTRHSGREWFDFERCARCGECLVRCQYLGLGEAEAVAEIERMIACEPTRWVHDSCVSCFACNTFCERGCHPYELILSGWHERYEREGLPVRAAYLMPGTTPNFRTDLIASLGAREQATVAEWAATEPRGEIVIYPGCNTLTLPHLLDLECLRDIPVAGSLDLCCGEMYYRMGLLDKVAETAERLTSYYRDADVGTMLFVCPAGLNMFSTILPTQFGASFPFRTRYLGDHLLEQLQAGSLALTHPLRGSVAVHDSCHGRVLGDEITGTVRTLYEAMGLTLREMAPTPEEGLCCGMAAGCARYRPDDILLATKKALSRARATRADELAVYCGGCAIVFALLGWTSPGAPPVRHLLEHLAEATGRPTEGHALARSLRLLWNITRETLPRLLSRENIRL